MRNHRFFRCAWRPFWIFAPCDFRSNFLKVYPGYFHSHLTPVHGCEVGTKYAALKANVIQYFIKFGANTLNIKDYLVNLVSNGPFKTMDGTAQFSTQ